MWMLAATGPDAVAQSAPLHPVLTGSTFTHKVAGGDTLARLAARFGVPVATLAALNDLPPAAMLGVGEPIKIDNRHIALVDSAGALVLNLPQRMVYFADGSDVRAYPVAVGKPGWATPVGRFEVVEKEVDPTWDVPPSIQEEMRRHGKPVLEHVAPGPKNPLGDRFIRLSFSGIGIHGTNAPTSIYRFATHGCIRMNPRDVEDLFGRVSVGTNGVIVYEPTLMMVSNGRVLIEVHPDVYGRAPAPLTRLHEMAAELGVTASTNWDLVARAVRNRAGIAVDVTSREARSLETRGKVKGSTETRNTETRSAEPEAGSTGEPDDPLR
jgi:L,D-transpeptidase ErfK/SrfK